MEKKYIIIGPLVIVVILVIAIVSVYYLFLPCLPDLLVESYTTEYVGDDYIIHITVKNDGCAKSDECLVYCNAISMTPPVGENEIRAQTQCILEELQPDEAATCSFTFKVQVLANEEVGRIDILVDAKNFVEESNEYNNIEWWIWP